MNGPIMKPRPKAAPIMPIRLATSSGWEISPIYARATAMLPFPAPARKRAATAMVRLPDSPNTVKKTVLESKPNIRIGLRPILSLNEPRIGVKMNWAREYTEITMPTQRSLLPTSAIPSAVARSWMK